MRLLIFLFALMSAFFSLRSFSLELDYTDLKPTKTVTKYSMSCVNLSNKSVLVLNDINTTPEKFAPYCGSYLVSKYAEKPGGICPPGDPELEYLGGRVSFHQARYKRWDWQDGRFGGCSNDTPIDHILYAQQSDPQVVETCPPDNYPLYKYLHNVEGENFCIKEKEPEPLCPEPTGSEIWVGGTSPGVTNVCYPNSDGTQCNIETDENGAYMLPLKYGSYEPVTCSEPEPEPHEPPTPTIPDDTPDPEPTPTPDPREPNDDTDPTESSSDLDSLNKINANLDVINSNLDVNSQSNDDRLDAIFSESQNSNDLLSGIKDNTYATGLNTSELLMELSYSNGLLQAILDKPVGGGAGNGNGEGEGEEEEKFTIKVERKNKEKGLNSIFTDDQRQEITDKIDEKKQEIEDYFEQIESESSALFDINPSLGGGYQERIEIIRGAEVDMGMGRLSPYFQLIAAAVMLCSTLTALYILLGP